MKRAFLLVVLLALVVPATASARVTTAAGLAADCNRDGQVVISNYLRVTGGSGRLKRDCFVTMARAATFGLQNVKLTGGNVAFVVSDARQHTQVRVRNSSIKLGDGGAIQLSPGCCGGEGEDPRSEREAFIGVWGSVLRAGTVEVSASVADRAGTTLVRDSTLRGTAAWSANPVTVRASASARGGTVTVLDSHLIGATGVEILSGRIGNTVARRNVFTFTTEATIATGTGGSCSSTDNTPPTLCTIEA